MGCEIQQPSGIFGTTAKYAHGGHVPDSDILRGLS
jgi:hypothetical protein